MLRPLLAGCLFLSLAAMLTAATFPRINTFSTAGFSGGPGPHSPVVNRDGSVEFALHAPRAQQVVLQLGEWSGQKIPLTRDAEGWWRVRLPDVTPGLYAYSFLVDGLAVIDPLNPQIKTGTVVYSSMVDVPGRVTPRYDELQDVPQGTLHVLRYRSSSQHRWQTVHVYLPAAYATETTRRFPVLYLRHGGGDDDHSWMQDGRAGVILDNLLAHGGAEPSSSSQPTA